MGLVEILGRSLWFYSTVMLHMVWLITPFPLARLYLEFLKIICTLVLCSLLQDGVMVLSATHRYKKKYVTTLLYKPIWWRNNLFKILSMCVTCTLSVQNIGSTCFYNNWINRWIWSESFSCFNPHPDLKTGPRPQEVNVCSPAFFTYQTCQSGGEQLWDNILCTHCTVYAVILPICLGWYMSLCGLQSYIICLYLFTDLPRVLLNNTVFAE